MTLTIGIDVGGTKIAGGVVDAGGRILEHRKVKSPAQDDTAITTTIADLVEDLASRHSVEAVGVGVAAYIDAGRSTVMFAANLAVRDLDLRRVLERRTGLPVAVENDANAAAWGEFAFGAGADVDDLLLLTVGTGVGGGLVLGGHLYRGAFGVAAEVGHLRVVPDGLPCGCGNRGCFEQYASGSALVRQTREAIVSDPVGGASLLARAGGEIGRVKGPLITEAARDGDEFAITRLAELGRWLGEGIASLAAVLDPAVTVIGGGVGAAGDLLLEPTRAAFRDQLIGVGHRPELEIRLAHLGNRAGVIGAADLARR